MMTRAGCADPARPPLFFDANVLIYDSRLDAAKRGGAKAIPAQLKAKSMERRGWRLAQRSSPIQMPQF